ncbi:acetylcholinesterase isoform X1 [Pogona vitticeps]
MMLHVLSCLILFFLASLTYASEEDTVVVTNSGPIRGKRLTTASGMVTAFLGIPYAEPPLGTLRFKKPLPHEPWSHILEATSYGNSCYQESTERSSYPAEVNSEATLQLSEDCLFLNLWVPHPRPTTPIPVFVWIHGGGFVQGSGSLDRSVLAATENIIVASMNYRLGSLGFLYLPPDAPGNAGLWDQQLALSWLRENMAAFGGDPSRITIGGQSAGGASAGFHLLSPASQPIFAQATVQSGATISPWAWVNPQEAKVRGRTLGQILDCTEEEEEDDRAVVQCLQRKEPGTLVQKSSTIGQNVLFNFPFVPTTDGEFLPDDPQKLLEAGSFLAKPVLTGFTPDEGTIFLFESPGFSLYNDSLISFEQLLEGLRLLLPEAPEIVIKAAALIYSGGEQGEARYRDAMIRASGDYAFLCPVASVANRMAEAGSPVFAYIFTHRPAFIVAPDWIGVPHCAELPYLFVSILSTLDGNATNSDEEEILSQRVMQYWGQFVRTGSPDGGSGKEWPLYTGQNFFRIGTEQDQAEETSPTFYCDFWKLLALGKSQCTTQTQWLEDSFTGRMSENQRGI